MPGVVVQTATRSSPSNPLVTTSGTYFAVGQSERGDTAAPVELRSMADYAAKLGNRVAYGALYDDLRTFFEEGGSRAFVGRVVGPSSTVGTLTLDDRAGSPVDTLRIDAKDAGAWSSSVSVEVLDGTVSNTFTLLVRYAGTLVERHANLTSPADAVAKLLASSYVRATDLGAATSAPNNNPAVAAAADLTAGSDDRSNITATHHTNALALFGIALGDGAVAIPGQPSSVVGAALAAHAAANNRIALLALARANNATQAKTAAASINSEFAGLFHPWITVDDGAGGRRTISPEGFVAACRARAHEGEGPWRAAAGEIARARFVLDVDQKFDRAAGDDLDAARVNAIRLIGTTVRLYGWKSLSTNEADYAYLTARDVLNRLVVEGEKRLEAYVFEPIDTSGQLLALISSELVGMLQPMSTAGGLYPRVVDGEAIDPGYSVDVGPTINTPVNLAAGQINAQVAVRVAPTGALITLTIVKVAPLVGV